MQQITNTGVSVVFFVGALLVAILLTAVVTTVLVKRKNKA